MVQALGQQGEVVVSLAQHGVVFRNANLQALGVQAVHVARNDLASIVTMAGILFVGTGLVERRAIAIGGLVAVLLYITQLFSPVQQLVQTFEGYLGAGLRRTNALLGEGRGDAGRTPRILPTSLRGVFEV